MYSTSRPFRILPEQQPSWSGARAGFSRAIVCRARQKAPGGRQVSQVFTFGNERPEATLRAVSAPPLPPCREQGAVNLTRGGGRIFGLLLSTTLPEIEATPLQERFGIDGTSKFKGEFPYLISDHNPTRLTISLPKG